MADKRKSANKLHFCPYCDADITEEVSPYCKACEVEIFYCPKCREAISPDKKICPHCGADIKEEAAKGG